VKIAHAAALLACLGGTAFAQSDSAEAEALIRQGVALRMKNQNERALPYFQKAFERARTPRTEGQLGLAEMALGYWTDAERHLAEALVSTDHPWIARNRATLDQALAQARTQVGEITVAGSPAGATVSVNGREVGKLPLPALRINKGAIEVSVRAPGYVDSTRSLRVEGGDRQQLTVALEKVGAKPEPVPLPATNPVQPPVDNGPKDQPGMAPRRKWAWGLAAGAAAAIGFGVVETVVWQKNRTDFNNHLSAPADNPTVTDRTMWTRDCDRTLANRGSAACDGLYSASRRSEVLSFVGYGAGVALGVGAAILFLGEETQDNRTAAICGPTLGPGFACRVAF
jgi:hypothetical protein